MEKKASNYLLLFTILFFSGSTARAVSSSDLELNDAIQKKDWPSVVLILQPKKGQNFEHDLTLAKALLSLERRQEAQKLLVELSETHHDERVSRLLQSAGTIFFNQDTSNLYYESLELIRALKFAEAKDRLEQALAKEPSQVLLLTRLIQVDLVLEKKERAATNLKIAQSVTAGLPELKLFSAKLVTDAEVASSSEDEHDLYREFSPIKTQLLENEVTATFWTEALKRAGKTSDLESLIQKTLKEHPSWTYLLMWYFQNANPNTGANALKTKVEAQIDQNLKNDPKNKDAFNRALDSEMKKSDNLWLGYVGFEALNAQWAALHPKPPAH